MFNDLLPVGVELVKRVKDLNPICKRCGEKDETVEHAIRDCNWSRRFWYLSSLQILDMENASFLPIGEWIDLLQNMLPPKALPVFCCLTWYIWYARNRAIFQNE